MSTVLLVILLILTVIMTGLILIQRSEGGALGIGGGGGGGGFMSGRSATTNIARMTAILGTIFMVLSLLLSVLSGLESQNDSRRDVGNEVEALTTVPDSDDGVTPSEEPVIQTDPIDPDE